MLEVIDLDQRISKEDYDKVFPDLQRDLGECQRLARAAKVPVIVVFEGWDAGGVGFVLNRLTQTLDPRGFKVFPIIAPTDNERMHPWMWRFWNDLPLEGDWSIFDHSWYGRVLGDRINGTVPAEQWLQAFEDIRQFEQQLADSGAVIVKLWLHISRAEQKRRFKRLLAKRATAWRVGKPEQRQHRRYDQWLVTVEEMIERTNSAAAPWTIVEATQNRFARVKVFQTVLAAVREELKRRKCREEEKTAVGQVSNLSTSADRLETCPTAAEQTILDRVDLSLKLSPEEYEQELEGLQQRLFKLQNKSFLARLPGVIAYEGWDAGGKGGNIKRVTRALDPRGYEVVPIAAPTAEEKAHQYLWRFWRHAPKAGHITIFDRTWYGRVLVERVEGFCTEAEWRRAYDEINEFERQLAEAGTVLVKFWLQIDAAEQLRRFQERQKTPYKQWKITEEDWRNREKRPRYEPAVAEMLERTSTAHAPWTILEANCKHYARIKALRTVAEALETGLKRAGK
jgi:AMP-polyphosphate phosphotransferase